MPRKTRDLLADLASIGSRAPRKSHLEVFIEFLREGGTIVDAWSESVQAEGDNIDRYFRPEGGLTKAHLDALVEVDGDARGMLAEAVVDNMLRNRGLPAMATHWAADSLGSDYWEEVETPEDFEEAAKEVELKYHRQKGKTQEQGEAESLDEKEINPYGDWSVIVTSKGLFTLTPLARRVFPVIYRAHRQGLPIHRDNVSKRAGIYCDRPERCLRSSKIWGVVVGPVPGKGGYMRLLFEVQQRYARTT